MTINHKVVLPDYDQCCKDRSECCDLQMFAKVIKETKDGTRSTRRLCDRLVSCLPPDL